MIRGSDGDGGGDVGVRVVVGKGEVGVGEVEDGFDVGVEVHPWQRARVARELQARLFEMVGV